MKSISIEHDSNTVTSDVANKKLVVIRTNLFNPETKEIIAIFKDQRICDYDGYSNPFLVHTSVTIKTDKDFEDFCTTFHDVSWERAVKIAKRECSPVGKLLNRVLAFFTAETPYCP